MSDTEDAGGPGGVVDPVTTQWVRERVTLDDDLWNAEHDEVVSRTRRRG